ncbi:hypothetical protein EYZ11_006395 [Aspergillus tanneri]|nr:hypothetical protein EYZ11_006395 [Aspergillus tanneri]
MYFTAAPAYWSIIEMNVGIFAASIPSFKAIASRFLPRLIGENSPAKKSPSKESRKSSGSLRAGDYLLRFPSAPETQHSEIATVMSAAIHEHYGSQEGIVIPEGRIYTLTEIEMSVENSPALNHVPSAHEQPC